MSADTAAPTQRMDLPMDAMHEKLEALKSMLKGYGRTAVAFSGGVDSTFLLKIAHDVLGDGCIALTARSEVFPAREHSEASAFCLEEGVRHVVADVDVLSVAVALSASSLASGDVDTATSFLPHANNEPAVIKAANMKAIIDNCFFFINQIPF